MTSGNFELIDPASIIINRSDRQRKSLTGIEDLIESIRNVGLINPPVVDRQLNLVAGERRLTAVLELGLSPIPVQFAEDLDPLTLHLIELEENIKRVDLSWQDHVAAVERYHQLRVEAEPGWKAEQTAKAIGASAAHVSRHLLVASMMDNPMVAEADRMSKAVNVAQRAKERKQANATRELTGEIDSILAPRSGDIDDAGLPEGGVDTPATAAIENTDFIHWARNYSGMPFNLIHCDFPYGVGVGDKSGQSARQTTGGYSDTPEIYFKLLEEFANNSDRFVDPSAHLIFWFSMDFYSETKTILEACGWRILVRPLIWHKSDNAGIIPDHNRGPRQTYETAFFGSRGDRKIVRAVANSFAAPTSREFHTSEKPRPVLTHFMRMVTDEHSRMLDPTCGSGNSVRVASELGAASALGLEINAEYCESARLNLADG